MKKSLMATTALVAASVAVSGAHAQDDEMMAAPVTLSVGGYVAWGVSLSSYEGKTKEGEKPAKDARLESVGIANSAEIQFHGSGVLDNGLGVDVRVELEGETAGDQIDETWVQVSGSFGKIKVGNDDPASETLSVTAPQASAYYGANSPSWTGTASPLFLTTKVSTDAASVLYFTPVVNGFQFGVSYAPEAETEALNGVAGNTDGGELTSAAFNYKGSIGEATGFSVGAGVANVGDDGTADADDTTHVTAGVSLSRGAYAIGASYRSTDDGTDDDGVIYEMGAQYSSGPWGVSLNWSHWEDDDLDKYGNEQGGDVYRLLGSYSLGGGVTLSGAIGMDQSENDKIDDSRLLGMAMSVYF